MSPDSKEVGDAAHRAPAVDIAAPAVADKADCKEAVSVVEEDVGMKDTASVSVAEDEPCLFQSSRYRRTYLSDPVGQCREALNGRLLVSISTLGWSRSVRGTYLSDPVGKYRKAMYGRLLVSINMLGWSRSVSPWRCSRAAWPHHVLLVSGLLLLPL